VHFVKANPILPINFTVTDAMLNEFYAALIKAGVKIDRQTFEDARKAVAQDLGLEIAYSKGGQEGWRKRSNLGSQEIRVAAELLRKSTSPASLFAAAANYEKTHVAAGQKRGSEEQR
jgi:hypothetical protein